MFSIKSSRWVAGAGLALALAVNLAGVGSASAQTLSANPIYTVQSLSGSATSVSLGTAITVTGAGYGADENVSFWLNVPDGTTLPSYSLGQTNSSVTGTVAPIDTIVGADDNGGFSYTLDTTGLPAGSYSLVAHGLSTGMEEVFDFTITGAPASPLAAASGATVAAGSMLTINATSFEPNEPIGLWINVPSGTTISNDSLGQTNTTVDGSVIPLDLMTTADVNGAFTYNLDTTGLPSGSYSLVAYGLHSKITGVISFTVQ